MKIAKIVLLASTLLTAVTAAAFNPIPSDPAVRIGTLPNGLTYYIRHNAEPAGQTDFFLAQRVGSVNEDDNQRGLAHFLEHMCFNGTEHFPGNSLIEYLESVGVKFGANLNAYTASDETVYNICEVPTARVGTQDSCLMILRDWSHGLLLRDSDIDAERGVIEGEWRQRNDAPSARLLEKTAPLIYPGSKYGRRLPIGTMDVVRNFDPNVLREFYHKWYNPENQCVIVVGDIDPERIEAKIRQTFGDIPRGSHAVQPTEIPGNTAPIATVQTDPEQPLTTVTVYIKHGDVADADRGTIAELRREQTAALVTAMLVDRFDIRELEADAPFANIGVGDVSFLLSHPQKALLVRANAKAGRTADCTAAIAAELKRAAAHGFTSTELERARLDARSALETQFAASARTTSSQFARRYVRHFLDGGPLPSDEAYYKMMKGVITGVTLDDANAFIREVVDDGGRDVVLYAYAPANTSDGTLTGADLSAAYTGVKGCALEAYTDTDDDTPLMTSTPTPGRVVAKESLPAFGAERWSLSNGIKVYVKQTDYSPDRVLVTAYSPGGFSQGYEAAKVPDYLLCNDVLAVSGVGELSSKMLRRRMVGTSVKCAVGVEKMEEQMSASANKVDLPAAMQLLYLKATALTPDSTAFAALMADRHLKLDNRVPNTTVAMGDSIHLNVYNRHPLGAKLSADDLDHVSLSGIFDIYRDRFSDMGDFSFFIVGDFDGDSLQSLVETYIASLPSGGRREKPADIGYRYYQGNERREYTYPMHNPQSIVYSFFNGECPYTVDNVVTASALGQILTGRLRKDLREERGWTYGVKTHCSVSAGMNGDDPSCFIMPVYVKVNPGCETATADIVKEHVQAVTVPGAIAADEVNAVVKYLEKNSAENATDNGYWALVMHLYDKFGQDMHTDYLRSVQSLTPERVSSFARTYIAPASLLQLIMRCE